MNKVAWSVFLTISVITAAINANAQRVFHNAADEQNNNKITLRDPTTPLGYSYKQQQPKPVFKLQAIFDRGGEVSAVINGRSVVVGDVISGWQVMAIRSQGVALRLNGESIQLALQRSIVK